MQGVILTTGGWKVVDGGSLGMLCAPASAAAAALVPAKMVILWAEKSNLVSDYVDDRWLGCEDTKVRSWAQIGLLWQHKR